ncbi:kinase-like domain-containing protein [Radiomyces spectabilis]|uniref:kinase-like domain-containing protein n=1 Tax=Radiomyces spectabilis TaxID=64574 RepID=UPI00221EA40E|nr:kinase-like domain-containing protein [Radiomyces spectabilis]KAI8372757.1 kinase-like domain-containing protein [Radiomyces spectabilis]
MGAVCCTEHSLDLDGEVDLSHFTLLRSVGKGAFGKVRVVQHKRTKQLYALKYINKAKCIQMRAVENIISERSLLEQINHELIVNLRYAFQDDDNLFMVLDLMLGGDLRFHLDRLGTMPENYVQFYAAEISQTLHYLHCKNIVHRDLKPDNILLDESGHVHLTDFNIAVQFNENKPLTSIAGSMAYIAPEILMKRGYFASVDWWSLGIVLYELLFGKRPLRAKTNEALQHAILHDAIHFPETQRVSPLAIDFIKGLLTRDITRRLGPGDKGFQRLTSHPWLKHIQWNLIEDKLLEVPFVPDSKRANFDPTHELEEILFEDNPLKVRKRNLKRSADSHANTSLKSSGTEYHIPETSPERQMMEDKFLTFDYTKPEENERRKQEVEQRRWAQKMAKTDSEKQITNGYATTRKAAGTYNTSVLDVINQKPPTPLSAADILKLEELARAARANGGHMKKTGWRPPSGILSQDQDLYQPRTAVQARDEYILKAGGVPPPTRPPPPIAKRPEYIHPPPHHHHHRRNSSDDSVLEVIPASPENMYRPILSSTTTESLVSSENLSPRQMEWAHEPEPSSTFPAAPANAHRKPPSMRTMSQSSMAPAPPPPTSALPPIPSEFTSLPSLSSPRRQRPMYQ